MVLYEAPRLTLAPTFFKFYDDRFGVHCGQRIFVKNLGEPFNYLTKPMLIYSRINDILYWTCVAILLHVVLHGRHGILSELSSSLKRILEACPAHVGFCPYLRSSSKQFLELWPAHMGFGPVLHSSS